MSDTRYLLDTNIISHLMRDAAGPAMQRVRALLTSAGSAALCTSVVVQCELLFGLQRSSSQRLHARYAEAMTLLEVLPLDESVPPHYADLRTRLERAGTPISGNDCLIAAHALALGATLVTDDRALLRIPGLAVENWLQPA